MGLFNRKKQKSDPAQNTPSQASQENTLNTSGAASSGSLTGNTSVAETSASESFLFGIEDIFHLKTENEVVVVGKVKGTIKPGYKASVINPGDDEQAAGSVVFSELEINHKKVNSATDTVVGILITIPEGFPLKIGSVFYSEGSSDPDIYKAYINALSASYFGFRHLVIEPDNLKKMSIGDIAELWCFVMHVIRTNKDMPEPTRKEIYGKIGPIADELAAAGELHTGVFLADTTYALGDNDVGIWFRLLVVGGVTVLGVVLVDNHLLYFVTLASELLVDELLDAVIVAVLGECLAGHDGLVAVDAVDSLHVNFL